ncbi:peptidase domain-containing ABC transporter [Marinobacter sp. JSM 1782161]|uniref:peptidase domain-containing ABC transporter n=1 Tax=Marinobacter sp. JSM 1782161 TaxID=2685906 RepID=UPI001403A9B9|nr:ATP-binding cassette domain-containing protein [Marinobacter sp. JSM 1782161]
MVRFSRKWTPFRKIVGLRRQALSVIAICSLVVYFCALSVPVTIQQAIDIIRTDGFKADVFGLFFLAPLLVLGEYLASAVRSRKIIELSRFFDDRLSRRLFVHLFRMGYGSVKGRDASVLYLFNQISRLRDGIINLIPQAIFELGVAVLAIVVIFFYDYLIGTVVSVLCLVFFVLLKRGFSELYSESLNFYSSDSEKLNCLNESISGYSTIKKLRLEPFGYKKWSLAVDKYNALFGSISYKTRRLFINSQAAGRLIALVAILIGCIKLANGSMSAGEIIAVQLLMGRVTGPLIGSGDIARQFEDVSVAAKFISDFLHESPPTRPALSKHATQYAGLIDIRDLSYQYPNDAFPVLRQLNLRLSERESIAIVGENGSGKTTLTEILLGLRPDYKGMVRVGGVELNTASNRQSRSLFGVLDQHTSLFAGTILQNIVACAQSYSEEELWNAIAVAGLKEFVAGQPAGLQSYVMEKGQNLSGGIRQRIGIARALVASADILVLDEPTSHIDHASAGRIQRELADLGKSKLVIVITHNPDALASYDRVFRLNAGGLVEERPGVRTSDGSGIRMLEVMDASGAV